MPTPEREALAELRAHCLAAIEHVGSHNSAEREREAKQAVRDRFSEVIAALSSQPPAPSWQPIEAFQDGEHVWAYCNYSHDFVPKPFQAEIEVDHLRGHWTVGTRMPVVAHYGMPLPSAPSAKATAPTQAEGASK